MEPKSMIFAGMVALAAGLAAASDSGSKELRIALEKTPVQLVANVVYSQPAMTGYPNVALRMDILRPASETPLPAVVFVPGGGLIHANKDGFLQQRLALAEAGFVVAAIEYRVAPTVLFPAPLEDVKAAVRYLRANAGRFGIDEGRIAAFGASAGGYLASLAGTTNGLRQFDQGEYLDQDSSVQAVVNFYGLSDLTLIGEGFPEEVQALHALPSATEALLVHGAAPFHRGGSIHDDPEKAAAANPITYIGVATPPFLLMHGDQDTLVSPKQTQRLHQALTERGVDSTHYLVRDAAHGGDYWLQPGVMAIVIDFLRTRLVP